ncbi:MAG: DNA mismatch repair endonuclease MutL [Lentihominibacter sp.]|jgi:DNA mismatch repair protein MutL
MIKVLDKHIADKIAAGEVVDRPVSIVKELLENSLDAGADAITVEIRDGGKSYIRVTDNGSGIDENDVEIAFKRHATSKISEVSHLDAIGTLGFRGEALTSICAVSRVELITRTADSKTGRKVIAEGSEIIYNSPVGCPVGTTITVKDLFYNVPARHKFMSGEGAETRRIIDMVSRIALSYAGVRINLINGRTTVFTTSGKGNILANIISIYGGDIGKDLITVNSSSGGYTLKGFVSGPANSLSSRSRQVFCVNGRVVSGSVLERGLEKAYKERMFHGRFPVAFLFLAMPPHMLDVNIHPTKREVRFDDSFEVEDFITKSVKEALISSEAVPQVHAKKRRDILNEGEKQLQEAYNKTEQVDIKHVLETLRESHENIAAETLFSVKEKEQVVSPDPFVFDDLKLIGSLFNTYIIASDENNFYMFDQHAAHERIFYERLKHQFESCERAAQQLLIPLNFNVSADVSSTEDNWIEQVRTMGYDIEFFGNNTYIVREIPAFMDISQAEVFLQDLFNEFSLRPDLTNVGVMDKIIIRSCKSAVKGGDILSIEESEALFSRLKACDNPFSCPHGRPTFIRMTRYEIERMFKRV